MPREQRCIGDDVPVPDLHIMREVRGGHDEVALALHGWRCPSSTRDELGDLLADDVVFPNDREALGLGLEGANPAGSAPNDRRPSMTVPTPIVASPSTCAWASTLTFARRLHRAFNDGIGTDGGRGVDFSAGIDDGGGMDHDYWRSPAARKLKYGSGRSGEGCPMMT